jgi:hypothetical protein
MKIIIETIPHCKQPYPTCGDYFHDGMGNLTICVSEEIGTDSALLVAIHELCEAVLCYKRGIKFADIDEFDARFEDNRKKGDTSEPGDDQNAPYRREHFFATTIERLMAAEMGVDWKEHDNRILALP